MTIVADFIARLLAIDPPVFSIVEGAAEFASIDSVPVAMPAAYVLIEAEASGQNARATGGPVLQRCEADVAVIIITANVSDATGGAAAGDIETLKRQVRTALIGFVPASSDDGTPVEHISGELLKVRSGTVWQKELFSAAFYLEES